MSVRANRSAHVGPTVKLDISEAKYIQVPVHKIKYKVSKSYLGVGNLDR